MSEILIQQAMTPAQKAQKLLKLKALKKEVDTQLAQMNDELLQAMKETGSLSIKTEQFTITRVIRPNTKVLDVPTLKKALEGAGVPYTLQETFGDEMKEVFKALSETKLKDTELTNEPLEILPGLETTVTQYVTVRVAK